MPTALRFIACLRITAWASPCVHVFLEGDPRRKQDAKMWAADDIYSALVMSLPGPSGQHGDFIKDIMHTAERTGRTR